jgi:hypothetical protein
MNILPVVLTILLILSLGATTFFRGHAATLAEKRSLEGYFNAHRKIWNKEMQAAFKKAPEKPKVQEAEPVPSTTAQNEQKPKEEEDEEEESVKKKYFRDKKCAHESGKLNLFPLLHDPDSTLAKHLYEPAARLIAILYQHAPFWKKGENLEYRILDALMKIEDRGFVEAIPEESDLAPIFYKMLKGTNTYTLGSSEGVPPFLDFFRDAASANNKCTLNFLHAPRPVLQALLGVGLVQKIAEAEKEENKPMPKKKFDPLLETFPQTKSELQELDFLIFNDNNKDETAAIGIDGSTGITLKR